MSSKKYGLWLWCLWALFVFRVTAQLVQWRFDVPFLPPFDAWHSSVLPYESLVLTQVVILAFCAWVARAFWKGQVEPSKVSAWLWLSVGGLYALVMAFRLVLGLTVLSSHDWFSRHLPTFFHLVLASFMIVAGSFHGRHAAWNLTAPGGAHARGE